jgi:hypothetical protein
MPLVEKFDVIGRLEFEFQRVDEVDRIDAKKPSPRVSVPFGECEGDLFIVAGEEVLEDLPVLMWCEFDEYHLRGPPRSAAGYSRRS